MVVNKGRLINFINGITGVVAGGQAVINMPVNQRYHRNILQCSAVNYTGGTALEVTKITGSGTGATATPTVVNGVVTAITIVAGGSGWNVGDTFTFTDATGTGFVGTVATVTGGPPGALATATVTNGGTPSAISPVTLLTSVRQLVNGVNMRDISPTELLKIAQANGYIPKRGELPLYYTNPSQNVNQQNEVTSWDLAGQSTFQIQLGISTSVSTPGIIGISEFDFLRNTRPGEKGAVVPFLQPVAQHSFSLPIVAGRNDINTLPFNFPIERLWLSGSTANSITQVEVYQDGNKVFEATQAQLQQAFAEYGFKLGVASELPDYINQTYSNTTAAGKVLEAAYDAPLFFDSAFISDPDQRWWKALSCQNTFILRVYSSVAQTLTVTMETLPGSFAS